jgi:hypothetical protein
MTKEEWEAVSTIEKACNEIDDILDGESNLSEENIDDIRGNLEIVSRELNQETLY